MTNINPELIRKINIQRTRLGKNTLDKEQVQQFIKAYGYETLSESEIVASLSTMELLIE